MGRSSHSSPPVLLVLPNRGSMPLSWLDVSCSACEILHNSLSINQWPNQAVGGVDGRSTPIREALDENESDAQARIKKAKGALSGLQRHWESEVMEVLKPKVPREPKPLSGAREV